LPASASLAFEQLLAEHFEANFATLVRRWQKRHHSRQATEDTVSDAYTRIYAFYREKEQAPPTLADLDRLIHTVIKNEIADEYRRQEKKANLEEAAAPDHEADDSSDWWERKSVSMPSVDAIALRRLVLEVLSHLSPRNREVMFLMIEGCSPPEIGAKLRSDKFYADIRYAKEQFRRVVLALAKSGNDVAAEFARKAFSRKDKPDD
jgi:RNA polymerase sigma factor (sigma-70 family)